MHGALKRMHSNANNASNASDGHTNVQYPLRPVRPSKKPKGWAVDIDPQATRMPATAARTT